VAGNRSPKEPFTVKIFSGVPCRTLLAPATSNYFACAILEADVPQINPSIFLTLNFVMRQSGTAFPPSF